MVFGRNLTPFSKSILRDGQAYFLWVSFAAPLSFTLKKYPFYLGQPFCGIFCLWCCVTSHWHQSRQAPLVFPSWSCWTTCPRTCTATCALGSTRI
jgi:hypothetical protein